MKTIKKILFFICLASSVSAGGDSDDEENSSSNELQPSVASSNLTIGIHRLVNSTSNPPVISSDEDPFLDDPLESFFKHVHSCSKEPISCASEASAASSPSSRLISRSTLALPGAASRSSSKNVAAKMLPQKSIFKRVREDSKDLKKSTGGIPQDESLYKTRQTKAKSKFDRWIENFQMFLDARLPSTSTGEGILRVITPDSVETVCKEPLTRSTRKPILLIRHSDFLKYLEAQKAQAIKLSNQLRVHFGKQPLVIILNDSGDASKDLDISLTRGLSDSGDASEDTVFSCIMGAELCKIFYSPAEIPEIVSIDRTFMIALGAFADIDFSRYLKTPDPVPAHVSAAGGGGQESPTLPTLRRSSSVPASHSIKTRSIQEECSGIFHLDKIKDLAPKELIPQGLESAICAYELLGWRETAEDALDIQKRDDWIGLALFDGHGGSSVSKALASRSYESNSVVASSTTDDSSLAALSRLGHSNLLSRLLALAGAGMFNFADEKIPEKVIKAVENLYVEVDESLESKAYEAGSTAIVCLLNKRLKKGFFINLGDSRALAIKRSSVFCKNVSEDFSEGIIATNDHSPRDPKERKRIQDAGGYLYGDLISDGIFGLSVSRAFGDFSHKPICDNVRKYWVGIQPDIMQFSLDEIETIVLACDGVWDVYKNREAANLLAGDAKTYSEPPAEVLCKKALLNRSGDNISSIIVDIPCLLSIPDHTWMGIS